MSEGTPIINYTMKITTAITTTATIIITNKRDIMQNVSAVFCHQQ